MNVISVHILTASFVDVATCLAFSAPEKLTSLIFNEKASFIWPSFLEELNQGNADL